MQKVCILHIIEQPSQIIFGHSSVHIAHEQFVMLAIEIYFCFDGMMNVLNLEFNCIPSIVKMKPFQDFLGRMHWMDIAIFIYRKLDFVYEHPIN